MAAVTNSCIIYTTSLREALVQGDAIFSCTHLLIDAEVQPSLQQGHGHPSPTVERRSLEAVSLPLGHIGDAKYQERQIREGGALRVTNTSEKYATFRVEVSGLAISPTAKDRVPHSVFCVSLSRIYVFR